MNIQNWSEKLKKDIVEGKTVVVKNMPDTEYHAITHLGSTSIINADKTLLHMEHYKPKSDSDLYKAYHLALLEKDRKSKDVIVCKGTFALGDNKKLKIKARAEGKLCLNESDGATLEEMLSFQKNSTLFQQFVDAGDNEVSFFCTFPNGLKVKARADSVLFDLKLFMDLKTIHTPAKKFNARTNMYLMESKGYHLQTAHYLLVIKHCLGEVYKPIHFISENAKPYTVYNSNFGEQKITQYIQQVHKIYKKIVNNDDNSEQLYTME